MGRYNMKKSAIALGLALASANASALPLIDFWAGAYQWGTEYSGSVAAEDAINLNIEDNLGLKDSDNTVFWAAFEHPVPLIPNVQIKQTALETSGTGTFNQEFTFGDETYGADVQLNSNIDLGHTDYTLYWGLPLPVVTVDFGLNIRKFDGELVISTDSIDGSPVILDAPVPMAFARVGAELPFTGLAVMAEGNYIGYKDTNHMDYQVVVRYTLPFLPVLDLNVEAGYRAFELNINPDDFGGDEGDLMADIDMSGFFLGVSAHL
jgi:outer membrane protein